MRGGGVGVVVVVFEMHAAAWDGKAKQSKAKQSKAKQAWWWCLGRAVQACVNVDFYPVLQNGMHEISWNITEPCLSNVGGGPYCLKEVPNPELPDFFHPLYPNVPGYEVGVLHERRRLWSEGG